MPVYEYCCDDCRTRFEEYLRVSTAPTPPCPTCGSGNVERVFSKFATEWMPSYIHYHNEPGKWD